MDPSTAAATATTSPRGPSSGDAPTKSVSSPRLSVRVRSPVLTRQQTTSRPAPQTTSLVLGRAATGARGEVMMPANHCGA